MAKSKNLSVFNTGNDVDTINIIKRVSLDIMRDLENSKKPSIQATKESADNAIYDPKLGFFVPGDKKITISLDAGSIKKMTRMLFVAKILIDNLNNNSVNSMREIFYRSKSYTKSTPHLKPIDFEDQSECDGIILELCAMVEAYREDFNVVANEKSGLTYCNGLTVTERLADGTLTPPLDLGAMGSTPYIPKNRPQDLTLNIKKGHKIDYVLAIESEGSASSLVQNGFLKRNNAMIVALGGQPTMGTRGWLKKIQDQLGDVPILAFLDNDPYSMGIFRTLVCGSYSQLIRSKDYSAQNIKLLGVLPSDIKKYDLDFYKVNEKDPVENRALKRASDMLKTDPFFLDKKNKRYREILEWLLKEKVRCEQQAYLSNVKLANSKISPMEVIIVEKIKNGDFL
jgi:DNA topoisomerase-6 subunit A